MKLLTSALTLFLLFAVTCIQPAFSAFGNQAKDPKAMIISPETNTVLSPDEFSKKNQDATAQSNQKLNQAVQNQLSKVPKIQPLPASPSDDGGNNNAQQNNTNIQSTPDTNPIPPPEKPDANSNLSDIAKKPKAPLNSDSVNQNDASSAHNAGGSNSGNASNNNSSPWIGKSNSSQGGNNSSGKQGGWGIRY